VSSTVTLTEHEAVLLLVSVAVHVAGVVPTGNVEPEFGTHASVTPGQLSEEVDVKLTTAVQTSGSFPTVMSAGQVTDGG